MCENLERCSTIPSVKHCLLSDRNTARAVSASPLVAFSFLRLCFLFAPLPSNPFSRYDGAMELSLHVVWKVIPGAIERKAGQSEGGLDILSRWGFLYTMAASVSLAAAAGASIKYIGFPGDLPNVVHCVHKLGYVPMKQTLPMICVSLFSIAAGGSLGPEAPLVAMSASATGWLSMHYFKHDMVMVRKCTIIGMAAGLSAFFGVQLGGKRLASCGVVGALNFTKHLMPCNFYYAY